MKGRSLKYIFLLIQLVLYVIFLTLDILGRNITFSNYIKFAVVVLCFLYAIINRKKSCSKQQTYLCYALAFTVISDILLLLSDYYIYGVLTFILAQQLYGMRITAFYNREVAMKSQINPMTDIILRLLYQQIFAILICAILLFMDVKINALLVLSILYLINICTNVVRSLKLSGYIRGKNDIKYFTIGMVLFLLCDINVGLFNLSDFLPLGQTYKMIYNVSSILMWTFYAPSQVFISLSSDTD
jgi:hypothetical protein